MCIAESVDKKQAPRSLVSGGAGFVGSHLVDKLLEQGHTVTAIDNLSTGRIENLKEAKKYGLVFHFVEGDISKCSELPLGPFDFIWHLASPASPPDYRRLSLETMAVNSEGTRNLLNLALQDKSTFLLASTSEVYGDPLVHPQPETYWGHVNPIGERACYDESKRFAEALTMEYSRRFGLDSRIIRIFNTYGPRMREKDGRVVSNFISQALQGIPLTIYGDGQQSRSFQYIDDLIEGICRTMYSSYCQPINLGNPKEFTVLELAQQVLALTGSQSQLTFAPLPQDDPRQRKPLIEVAKKVLQWEPIIPLQEGLRRTIADFRKYYQDSGAVLQS
ncbi:UDP-glucuronic acid decarboxylase family protein [Heliorestis convoluta]|uniref:SDR family oxidoreductase n=1 Tax=Heliorestis convoluta TaxID=356322 RepID=A0A5Q2N5A5_9FIRM|nr:UDP-glucuronic acid decarboxylase family protein [Heliorestis convoluta]QGG48806.1 SDR family oxidoreductase [Heliorestis convoluta]